MTSYLYENSSGGLTRVEYTGGQVVVENYTSSFAFVDSRTIQPELPIWGGFFAGETYNFLIFGQNNPAESDSTEVIRVVKYDKNWKRLGAASLKGANTVIPFDAGSLRCDEYGGYLYIRTCHEMYTSDDGLNHQANITMAVRQSDMTITDSFYDVMNIGSGYVSHSFNQFILVDEDGKIITLDHGDAYPPYRRAQRLLLQRIHRQILRCPICQLVLVFPSSGLCRKPLETTSPAPRWAVWRRPGTAM